LRPLILLTTLTIACERDAPVLTGIPSSAILRDNITATADTETTVGSTYQKHPGVLVDIRHFGGKNYRQMRDRIDDQMGALLAIQDLDNGRGRELRFERGILRLSKNTIYMIRVPLPSPLRRSEALEKVGFPPFVGGYSGFHREYRLHNEWGFRRIRMKRENRRSERVTEVEAWHWLPGERRSGR
jgi:hypothetical protein